MAMSKQSRARARRHRKNTDSAPKSGLGTVYFHPKHVGTMALWIATPFGVLMPGTRPPHTYDPETDPRSIQVRTREKAYLDRFRELYCPELGAANHFPHHDYPWKAYVTKESLAQAVAAMVLDTDSEVFKPLTSGPKGLGNSKLEHALHANYSSWWSTHLYHGDGTSSFDRPVTVSSRATGSTSCSRMGHWFTAQRLACVSCGEPRPANWTPGSPPVYPAKTASFKEFYTPPPLTPSWGLGGAEHGSRLADVKPWEYGEQEGDPENGTDYDDLHYGLLDAVGYVPGDDLSADLFAKSVMDYDPVTGTCPECGGDDGEHDNVCGIGDALLAWQQDNQRGIQ